MKINFSQITIAAAAPSCPWCHALMTPQGGGFWGCQTERWNCDWSAVPTECFGGVFVPVVGVEWEKVQEAMEGSGG